MKNSLLVLVCIFTCLWTSCKTNETDLSLVTPECVQTIIGNLQENDTNPDCFASVKRYTFEGAAAFEIQSDACLDGSISIIDADCNNICTINSGFIGIPECSNSANFYDEAVFVELVWLEEN